MDVRVSIVICSAGYSKIPDPMFHLIAKVNILSVGFTHRWNQQLKSKVKGTQNEQ